MFQDQTQAPILLCLGQKGGGKSFRTMTLIMWLLHHNVFDRYMFILPTFHFEASNSYAWLTPFKDRVFISTEYTPELSQAFLNREDEKLPPHEIPRTFLWLDDVGCNETFRMDRAFVSLLSIARHKRLSVCLCFHSLTSGHTLSPFLRQNITHTLLFRVTNEKLLESIFEELISMTGQFERFRDFKYTYNLHTCSKIDPKTGVIQKNFNGMCINNSLGCIDWKIAEWFPEETTIMLKFLKHMQKMMEQEKIPANKKTAIDEVSPEVIEDIRPQPVPDIQESTWNLIKQAALHQPDLFLFNPRHMKFWERNLKKK